MVWGIQRVQQSLFQMMLDTDFEFMVMYRNTTTYL